MATTIIRFKSAETMIPAEMLDATGTPNGGVVIIAYGSDGITDDLNGPWASMIRDYANELSGKGFVTLIPDYFSKTTTKPGKAALEQIPIYVDTWQATVGDAITHAKTLPGVVTTRVGLLGFSLGGHICLRLRAQTSVLAVFFAPELQGLGSATLGTLHAQIRHGLADTTVPSTDAKRIDSLLKAEGGTSEVFFYEGAGHGFVGINAHNTSCAPRFKGTRCLFVRAKLVTLGLNGSGTNESDIQIYRLARA